MSATESWAEQLAAWTIPAHILDAAPANPYAFPDAVIRRASIDPRRTPTGAAISERLHHGESLLDVGCGAGRISGPLAADYRVTGIEPRENLRILAAEWGIATVAGRWPEAAVEMAPHPIVLSTHVAYDVSDITPFLRALHRTATRRVVLEVSAAHPWVWTGPLFKRLHDLPRPSGPSADDLSDVITEALGVTPGRRDWRRPGTTYASLDDVIAHTRQMLCLPAAEATDTVIRDHLLEEATLLPDGTAQMNDPHMVSLWWDVDL